MYTKTNYKTKKALKDAVASGEQVQIYDNSLFSKGDLLNGTFAVSGPHYPEPHKWYAQVTVKDNVILSVK